MRFLISSVLLFLLIASLQAQTYQPEPKRRGKATRAEIAPKIDGILDDPCWQSSEVFTGFRQYEPYSGEPAHFRTEVRLVFDDEGIYVGAMMYDPWPDSIRTQLGPRDGDRDIIADYFNVDLGPYNDGINGCSFKITASGVQTDIRRSSGAGGRDLNWDAVWASAARVNDSGWVAEIKVPFSAIRFPGEGDNIWGLNFWRYVQRYSEWSSWNYADKSHGTSINYLGELEGIVADPPVRISVTPYISGYFEDNSQTTGIKRSFSGGADLKVGLSEAFTLDATLIPDFKQVQSDDQVLNLTPYEVKYNERRQFFTEGTDVFSKGNIFYTRRVGSEPSGYKDVRYAAGDNEIVESNPQETRLLNATKISGRTRGGLGIGVFNGITGAATATILDTISGDRSSYITQPLTNYNMIVIDQNLGEGSYVSLANTNVLRSGPATGRDYTANVTATDIRFLSSNREYSFALIGSLSQKYYSGSDDVFGHSLHITGGKTGGSFRIYYTHSSISDKYDPNDMGYLRRNNEFINSMTFGYNIYHPVGHILNSTNSVTVNHEMLYSPRNFSTFDLSLKSSTTFKNQWILSLSGVITPSGTRDYYEPRSAGRMYFRPPSVSFGGSVSTDSRKVFAIGISGSSELYFSDYRMHRFQVALSPSLKIRERFVISHRFSYDLFSNDIGYIGKSDPDNIFFGMRRSSTLENSLNLSYIFSASSYLDLRLRHYWSGADYNGNFYLLRPDGTLEETAASTTSDVNQNYFNIDMGYTWRFAPGSELKIVWKNAINQTGNVVFKNFSENIRSMLDSPVINSISIKMIYYLDYHTLRTGI